MNCRPAKNCAPCGDCPPAAAPVLPRCNNTLPNGVFSNATVTVEGGCVVSIVTGAAPLYTPDPCCATVGGETGGGALDGAQGPPGAAATVAVGSVTTIAYGNPATVINSGTAAAAILNFQIPRGPAGAAAPIGTGLGYSEAGIEVTNGLVQALPLSWPPVHTVSFAPGSSDKITLAFSKAADGTVSATVDTSVLEAEITAQIVASTAGFQAQIDAQNLVIAAQATINAGFQAQIDALNSILTPINSTYSALTAKVNACCP